MRAPRRRVAGAVAVLAIAGVADVVGLATVSGRWIVCKKLALRGPAWSRAITITA